MKKKTLTEQEFQAAINSMDDHGKDKPHPMDKIFEKIPFDKMPNLNFKRIPTSILQELSDYFVFRTKRPVHRIIVEQLNKRGRINLKKEKRFFILDDILYDNHKKDAAGCPITVDVEGLGVSKIEICDSLNAKDSELLSQYSDGSFV